MNVELIRKEFGGYYDYFVLDLLLPTISIEKDQNAFPIPRHICDVNFETRFRFVNDKISYHFSFSLFGFGLSFYRQWSY